MSAETPKSESPEYTYHRLEGKNAPDTMLVAMGDYNEQEGSWEGPIEVWRVLGRTSVDGYLLNSDDRYMAVDRVSMSDQAQRSLAVIMADEMRQASQEVATGASPAGEVALPAAEEQSSVDNRAKGEFADSDRNELTRVISEVEQTAKELYQEYTADQQTGSRLNGEIENLKSMAASARQILNSGQMIDGRLKLELMEGVGGLRKKIDAARDRSGELLSAGKQVEAGFTGIDSASQTLNAPGELRSSILAGLDKAMQPLSQALTSLRKEAGVYEVGVESSSSILRLLEAGVTDDPGYLAAQLGKYSDQLDTLLSARKGLPEGVVGALNLTAQFIGEVKNLVQQSVE